MHPDLAQLIAADRLREERARTRTRIIRKRRG